MTITKSKTTFNHLPNELVVKVFNYSNELPLIFTCKRYYYLVMVFFLIYIHIYLYFFHTDIFYYNN